LADGVDEEAAPVLVPASISGALSSLARMAISAR
jgi:hypothetical protein